MLDEKDVKKIRGVVKHEVREGFGRELKPIKEDIAKIRKDVSTLVGFFDSEILDLRQRVERIEEVLNLKVKQKTLTA